MLGINLMHKNFMLFQLIHQFKFKYILDILLGINFDVRTLIMFYAINIYVL